MRTSNSNKAVSVLLSVAMCPMLVPTAAFAAEDGMAPGQAATQSEAQDEAQDEGNVVDQLLDQDDDADASVQDEEQSYTLEGTCGAEENEEGVKWSLEANEDGYTLSFVGEGEMASYSGNIVRDDATQPWRESQTGVSPKEITKVIFGEGITNIGAFACNGLSNVSVYEISATVQNIGVWGIDFESIDSINLEGNANFKVEGDALLNSDGTCFLGYFGGAEPVSEYVLPSGVEKVDSGAFVGCDASRVVFGEGVTTIGGYLMSNSSTREVCLPKSLFSIGVGAFSGNETIEKVSFSSGLTELPDKVFLNCSALREIDLPDTLETLSTQAFMNCTSLSSLVLPEALKTIEFQAIKNCSSLARIVIPDNVDTIEAQVFLIDAEHNPGLEEVVFGKHLPKVISSNNVWMGQTKLSTIDLSACEDTAIPDYLFKGMGSIESVSLPADLKAIGEGSFLGCSSLKSVVFPDSLVKIGAYAFQDCASLETVVYGSGIDDVGTSAFGDCTSLKRVDLHRSSKIGELYCNGQNMGQGGDWSLTYATRTGSQYTSYYLRSESQAKSVRGNLEWGSGGAGTGNLTNIFYVVSDEKVVFDATADQPLSKADCQFAGWYESKDCTGESVSPKERGLYFARFIQNKFEDIADYRGDALTAPTADGKVFAGWFEDAGFTKAISSDAKEGPAYAKFVDASVLGQKRQISTDRKTMRLVSSVDSLNYKEVGFDISIGDKSTSKSTTSVYETIQGGTTIYQPTFISDASRYFFTYEIWNIPEGSKSVQIAATPFWVTLDGTKVAGTDRVLSVDDLVDAENAANAAE